MIEVQWPFARRDGFAYTKLVCVKCRLVYPSVKKMCATKCAPPEKCRGRVKYFARRLEGMAKAPSTAYNRDVAKLLDFSCEPPLRFEQWDLTDAEKRLGTTKSSAKQK